MRYKVIHKIQRMFWRVRSQQDLDPGAKRVAFSPCWAPVYDAINRVESDGMGWRALELWDAN